MGPSSVWKHRELGSSGPEAGLSPSQARGHECPAQHAQQQGHFILAGTLLALGKARGLSGSFKDIIKVVPPSTDWGVSQTSA